MSTLILLRHAQASFGADRYDSLSELGHQQGRVVGRHLAERERRFTHVHIGPRERHRLTARYALGALGVDDTPYPGVAALDEFAEGQQILAAAEARQGVRLRGADAVTGVEARRRYAEEIAAWTQGRTAIEGVPDVGSFRRAVADWLAQATAAPESGQRVLAVTSGGVIAAIMATVLGLPDASVGPFMSAIHNVSLTELAFSRGRPPSLVSFNATGHLPDALLARV